MSNQTQINLNRLAAERAQAIIKRTKDKKASEVDNTITKALGVLQENGVYACFLYLLAKEKENGSVVVAEMLDLLDKLGFGWQIPKKNGKIETTAEVVLSFLSDTVTIDL